MLYLKAGLLVLWESMKLVFSVFLPVSLMLWMGFSFFHVVIMLFTPERAEISLFTFLFDGALAKPALYLSYATWITVPVIIFAYFVREKIQLMKRVNDHLNQW